MIDVGANIGLFSLVGAKCVGPRGIVHAFEPNPDNFARLERNLKLSFSQITCFPVAVARQSTSVTIGLDRDTSATSDGALVWNAGNWRVGGSESRITVSATSLDDHIARHLLNKKIRLLKLDAEGYEVEVFQGAEEVLASGAIDTIIVEVTAQALAKQEHRIVDVVSALQSHGYALFRSSGKLKRWQYTGEPQSLENVSSTSVLGRLRQGLRDRNRRTNLIAIRKELIPRVAHASLTDIARRL